MLHAHMYDFSRKRQRESYGFWSSAEKWKKYRGLMRETTNNVPNTKGEILLRKHVINLTTKHKGVITKWNIKSP